MTFRNEDVFGLVRPSVDVHTLGISLIADLLRDCGYRVVIADEKVCEACNTLDLRSSVEILDRWISENRITRVGFSYRLDAEDGVRAFELFHQRLRERLLLANQGGPLRRLFFAGLPAACDTVQARYGNDVPVFQGDESPAESLRMLGVPESSMPPDIAGEPVYDKARMEFARTLVADGRFKDIQPVDRSGYRNFGTERDGLADRVAHGVRNGLPPLMRAHVGPYGPNREEAVRLFTDWAYRLASSGLLDVLSIGTSQLTQSAFGKDWDAMPNGGGVPINSEDEYRAIWRAARPMLVRTYAGTADIPALARMHDDTIHNAWHALSFWWFCQLDGRGPNDLLTNLRQHFEVLKYAAEHNRPVEPNVPHHFGFRAADDITYVVSGLLGAGSIRRMGVKTLVLQTMLNTPKQTWGVQDLAKCRALLQMVREDAGPDFNIILQPRAGLDYLSHNIERAKIQLAAASILMDDIEPRDAASPQVIHVVSYSEGSHLATPDIVVDSIRITRHAIDEYRTARRRGEVDDMGASQEVETRTRELVEGARKVMAAIRSVVADPWTPEGLDTIFRAGFLPVPALWGNRGDYPMATNWTTKLVNGGVCVIDESGRPVSVEERTALVVDTLRKGRTD
jgi:hypothetical protein